MMTHVPAHDDAALNRSQALVAHAPSSSPTGHETVIDRGALFLVIILVPTIPFSAFRIPTHSFLLPYSALAVGMFAYWCLISFKTPRTSSRTARYSAIVLMLFGAWATLSLIWSQNPQLSHLLSLMFYLASTAAIVACSRISPRTLHKASTLLLTLMTLLVIYALYLVAAGKTPWFEFAPQSATQLGTRNSDAFMIATIFPMAFVRAIMTGTSKRVRLLAVLAGAVGIAAILLSLSRSSTVGIVIAALVTAAIGASLIPVRLRSVVVAVLLSLAALFILHSYFGSQELSVARFQTIDESSRLPLADMAYEAGLGHLGNGLGYFEFSLLNPYGEDAHDAYLNLFAELGLPGLFLFCLLFALPLYRYLTLARQLRRRVQTLETRTLYLQGLGLLVTLALMATTDTFYKSIYFWIIYQLAIIHLSCAETEAASRHSVAGGYLDETF